MMKFEHTGVTELTMLSERKARADFGSRSRAAECREEIERALARGLPVELDFDGVEATQSFVDELVGVLVLRRGPAVLQQLKFRRCSDNIKAIIRFVAADRAEQFAASRLERSLARH